MDNGWANVLAAVGGGLQGGYNAYEHQQDDQRKEEMQQQLLKLKDDIAHLQEGGKNDRTAATLKSKKEIADAERERRTQETTDKLSVLWDRNARQWDQGQQRIDATNNATDSKEGMFWGGTLPAKYDQMDTTATTARRGQDLRAASSKYAADSSAGVGYDRNAVGREAIGARTDTAGANTRARNVLGVLNLKAKGQNNLLGDNATDWADEFDRLYKDPDAAAGEAVQAAQGQPGPAPRPAGPPPGPVAPPPPAPAAPPPVIPKTPPKGLMVGAMVTLKNGTRVTVTKINPDGTFEYK